MFGAFILSCGITHAFHVVSPWIQLYSTKRLTSYLRFNDIELVVKLATAIISIATAISFIHLIPFALQLPSPSQLKNQIQQRKVAQRKVKKQYNTILVMSNMMKKIRDAANSTEILEIAAQEIGKIFYASRVTVHRFNTSVSDAALHHPDPIYLSCDAEYSCDGQCESRSVPLCRFLEQVVDTDEPLVFRARDKDHAHDGNFLFQEYLEDGNIESVICVSTSYNHSTNGLILLHFTSPTHHCNSNHIAMLEEIAGQIGIALQHALDNEQLELDRDQAQKASTEKTEFLLMMSHEVRTPLNAISGMNTMLKSTSLTQEQQECIKIIDESGDILLGIINSFLDLSKLEISKLELEKREFNLHESLDNAVKLFTSNAKNQKNIDVMYNRDPWLPIMALGDRYRIQQILINIISNAVKFTGMNGKVTIDVSCIDEEPRNPEFVMQVSVQDTGIGMNEQQIEQLFKPFSQVHSSGLRRKFGGTGLGLCICKRLSNLMDGDVKVESEMGKGSTFTVAIKLGKVDHDFPQKIVPRSTLARMIRRRSSIGSEAANILVAEDNPVNQRVAVALLRKLGYQNIEVVSNGKLAVEAVRRRNFNNICLDYSPFDVILMDVSSYYNSNSI
jgi:signal transduction histidine kinase